MTETHPAERFFSGRHPINSYLAMEFEGVHDGVLSVVLTAPASFVADTESGATHSGLATLVLDSVMGSTVMGNLDDLQPIATAGLTTQHLRRARAGERMRCNARFIGIHEDMAHISGELLSAESGEVLSVATGTFMIGTRSKPLGVRV